MNKAIVLAATALIGLAAPASATAIADAPSAEAMAGADAAAFTTHVTVVDDGRQAKPSSFTAVADSLYDIVAPLTFTVDPTDGTAAVKGVATDISFVTDGGTVVVKRRPAGAFDAAVSDASILPDAATWAMMLVGFVMIGFGMRYGIRRSNAKFDQKVRRIAEGLDA